MFYVYILKSVVDSSLYVGFSDDLRRRFKEHNTGQSKYTRNKLPWKLVYYEAYVSKKDAAQREKRLKHFQNSYAELRKRVAHSIHDA